MSFINTSIAASQLSSSIHRDAEGRRKRNQEGLRGNQTEGFYAHGETYEARQAHLRFQTPPGRHTEVSSRRAALAERKKIPAQQRAGLPSLRQPWHSKPWFEPGSGPK